MYGLCCSTKSFSELLKEPITMRTAPGVQILGQVTPAQADILSLPAQAFVATLNRCFNARRIELLQRRDQRQREIDAGKLPDFLAETAHIRADATWRGAPPAPGMIDRRVEITGPVDRKMVINALNSGASTFMADFEGALITYFSAFSLTLHCPACLGPGRMGGSLLSQPHDACLPACPPPREASSDAACMHVPCSRLRGCTYIAHQFAHKLSHDLKCIFCSPPLGRPRLRTTRQLLSHCCTLHSAPLPHTWLQAPSFHPLPLHPLARQTDSNAPTWFNNLDGHVNLRDALRRTITYTAPNGECCHSVCSSVRACTCVGRW